MYETTDFRRFRSNLTLYNLRTKLHYFSKGHRRMEFPSDFSSHYGFAGPSDYLVIIKPDMQQENYLI